MGGIRRACEERRRGFLRRAKSCAAHIGPAQRSELRSVLVRAQEGEDAIDIGSVSRCLKRGLAECSPFEIACSPNLSNPCLQLVVDK